MKLFTKTCKKDFEFLSLEEISKIDVLKEKGILYPYDIERTGIQWKE